MIRLQFSFYDCIMCTHSLKRYSSQWTFVRLWGPTFLLSVSRLSNLNDKEAQRNVRTNGLQELWKVPLTSCDSVPSRSSGKCLRNTGHSTLPRPSSVPHCQGLSLETSSELQLLCVGASLQTSWRTFFLNLQSLDCVFPWCKISA